MKNTVDAFTCFEHGIIIPHITLQNEKRMDFWLVELITFSIELALTIAMNENLK